MMKNKEKIELMKNKEKIELMNKAKDGNELILIAYAIVVSQGKN